MTAETLGFAMFVVALVTFIITNWFLGGRRWRSNYDAEHTRAERLQATLVEKDQTLEGQGDRLRRLDEVVQELGGGRVAQKIVEAQAENLRLFKDIADNMASHERRANERHERAIAVMQAGYDQMSRVNADGFEKLARAFENGDK